LPACRRLHAHATDPIVVPGRSLSVVTQNTRLPNSRTRSGRRSPPRSLRTAHGWQALQVRHDWLNSSLFLFSNLEC
jgi:hypothetical protein